MRARRVLLAVATVVLCACRSSAPSGGEPEVVAPAAPAAAPVAVTSTTVTPMQMVAAPIATAAVAEAPWSLTASDGSGLELVRVDAKAVVEGPLAFTELHLWFHNPEDRTREGTFAITLPSGAAV